MLLLTATGAVGASGQQFSGWPLHRRVCRQGPDAGNLLRIMSPKRRTLIQAGLLLAGK